MATQTPQPITHVYKEINEGKYRSVKHYELIKASSNNVQLTKLLNLSKDRNCAKSLPVYWLQIHDGKKWIKPRLTGLFKTEYKNVFKGDTQRKRNLLIFEFLDNGSTLVIKYFQDYFTGDLRNVSQYINS
ncbi:hypothetical protein H4O18_04135 [Arenibacter sp. BSSL-BM3]|uniref:Protein kinase domain-containing protein n=1 Tax=Arenibacter arenosicollis TaxID=2762274 RepID=A0ABR7QJ12_9FLAO|nr:hypothetical protein [Arenibacter arenosicollis]MBC8767173.1 hypothetical protein [Arenibacter arenosicollis]